MSLALFFGEGGFQLLPVGFCRGQAVVAVANGQHHGGLARGCRPPPGKRLRVSQRRQGGIDLGNTGGVLHRPAPQVSAAQHQFAVIEQRQFLLAGTDGLDERLARIVGQHHHVRRFSSAPRRTFRRGGIRSTTVLSLGRMAVWLPGA